MARATENSWPELQAEALKDPLVFVIDMNKGFARKGALADPEIEKISTDIEEVLKKTNPKGVFICDTHEKGCKEFDFFPEHCVKGSEEAEILENLQPYIDKVVEKNSINAFLSDDFKPLLSQLDQRDLIVTGCCTDLCVLQFALALQSWINEKNLDSRVILPVNCVDTYDIETIHPAKQWNDFALANMKSNGIEVISRLA